MNSGFKGETRILHSDESRFQSLREGRFSLCRIRWPPAVSVRAPKSAGDPHRLTLVLAGIRRWGFRRVHPRAQALDSLIRRLRRM